MNEQEINRIKAEAIRRSLKERQKMEREDPDAYKVLCRREETLQTERRFNYLSAVVLERRRFFSNPEERFRKYKG